MSFYLLNKHCPQCGHKYESTLANCPHCHHDNESLKQRDIFRNDIHVSPFQNLGLFCMGLLGFQLFGLIVATIVQSNFVATFLSSNPGASAETIAAAWVEAYKADPGYGMTINGVSYIMVAIGVFLILWQGIKEFGKSFTKLRNIGHGVLGFFGLLLTGIILNMLTNILRPATTANANQSALTTIATGGYALYAIVIFGFVGPICEELTYRVGLFSFIKRFSRTAAFIIAPIVFGMIHFDWTAFASGGETLVNELINIPDYIIAGLIFSYLYDEYGIAGSTTAHILNNVYSISMMLLLSNSK